MHAEGRMTTTPPKAAALDSIDSAALLLTADQACRVLNVSRPTLYRLMGDGLLPSLRVRGRRMFRRADLERFVARPAKPVREAQTTA
jgi:excisionase family DNA binding protein